MEIEVDGQFNASNSKAVDQLCGAKAPLVKSLLANEISQVLIRYAASRSYCRHVKLKQLCYVLYYNTGIDIVIDSAKHPELGCDAQALSKTGDDMWECVSNPPPPRLPPSRSTQERPLLDAVASPSQRSHAMIWFCTGTPKQAWSCARTIPRYNESTE